MTTNFTVEVTLTAEQVAAALIQKLGTNTRTKGIRIGKDWIEEGGFFAGLIRIAGRTYGIVVAPKADGETISPWNDSDGEVAGALSYSDGVANTAAMEATGSELAKWAMGLNINGHADWYIPSRDELEVIYRAFKPSTIDNCCSFRDGENVSSVPPSYAYTAGSPEQTAVGEFKASAAQAFEDAWYWSSTQSAAYSRSAWLQNFADGYQDFSFKDYRGRARAVRRIPVSYA